MYIFVKSVAILIKLYFCKYIQIYLYTHIPRLNLKGVDRHVHGLSFREYKFYVYTDVKRSKRVIIRMGRVGQINGEKGRKGKLA